MPVVTPPATQPSNARSAAPPPPEREDHVQASRSKSAVDRVATVTLEPHWTAAIDAATD